MGTFKQQTISRQKQLEKGKYVNLTAKCPNLVIEERHCISTYPVCWAWRVGGSSCGHTDFHPHLARLRTAASGLPATCKPHPCLQFRNCWCTHATVGGTKICTVLWLSFGYGVVNNTSFDKGSLLNWHRIFPSSWDPCPQVISVGSWGQ